MDIRRFVQTLRWAVNFFAFWWIFVTPSFAGYLDVYGLIQDIRTEKKGAPVKIEDLIEALPSDMRDRFALVYESRSSQALGTSMDKPRIIMTSHDGSLTLAMAGDASQPNGQILEVIAYDRNRHEYEWGKIDFNMINQISRDVSLKNSSEHGFEFKPPLCISCHSESFRPNWDSYPLWEKTYGTYHPLPEDAPLPEKEQRAWERFKQLFSKTGRYRLLGIKDADTLEQQAFRNIEVDRALSTSNSDRIAYKLSLLPERYRTAMLSALKLQGEGGSFYLREVLGADYKKKIAAAEKDIYETQLRHNKRKLGNLLEFQRPSDPRWQQPGRFDHARLLYDHTYPHAPMLALLREAGQEKLFDEFTLNFDRKSKGVGDGTDSLDLISEHYGAQIKKIYPDLPTKIPRVVGRLAANPSSDLADQVACRQNPALPCLSRFKELLAVGPEDELSRAIDGFSKNWSIVPSRWMRELAIHLPELPPGLQEKALNGVLREYLTLKSDIEFVPPSLAADAMSKVLRKSPQILNHLPFSSSPVLRKDFSTVLNDLSYPQRYEFFSEMVGSNDVWVRVTGYRSLLGLYMGLSDNVKRYKETGLATDLAQYEQLDVPQDEKEIIRHLRAALLVECFQSALKP